MIRPAASKGTFPGFPRPPLGRLATPPDRVAKRSATRGGMNGLYRIIVSRQDGIVLVGVRPFDLDSNQDPLVPRLWARLPCSRAVPLGTVSANCTQRTAGRPSYHGTAN